MCFGLCPQARIRLNSFFPRMIAPAALRFAITLHHARLIIRVCRGGAGRRAHVEGIKKVLYGERNAVQRSYQFAGPGKLGIQLAGAIKSIRNFWILGPVCVRFILSGRPSAIRLSSFRFTVMNALICPAFGIGVISPSCNPVADQQRLGRKSRCRL